jgi:hypothetical protein
MRTHRNWTQAAAKSPANAFSKSVNADSRAFSARLLSQRALDPLTRRRSARRRVDAEPTWGTHGALRQAPSLAPVYLITNRDDEGVDGNWRSCCIGLLEEEEEEEEEEEDCGAFRLRALGLGGAGPRPQSQ